MAAVSNMQCYIMKRQISHITLLGLRKMGLLTRKQYLKRKRRAKNRLLKRSIRVIDETDNLPEHVYDKLTEGKWIIRDSSRRFGKTLAVEEYLKERNLECSSITKK